jgi:hypothetical protein
VVDFRAEVLNEGDNDVLRLFVETRSGQPEKAVDSVRKTFQITPQVTLLARGTIAREFEAAVKPPRFVDRRG